MLSKPYDLVRRLAVSTAACGIAFGATGCFEAPHIQDGIEETSLSLHGQEGSITTPYAVGTIINFRVVNDTDEWIFTSNDDDVIAALGSPPGAFEVTGPGIARITARQRAGDEDPIAVLVGAMEPTRYEVHAAGPTRAHNTPYPVTTPNVLIGGQAAFEIRYFHNDVRLFGSGLLEVSQEEAVSSINHHRSESDWLVISATEPGAASIDLSTRTGTLGVLEYEAVTESAIAAVEILDHEPPILQSGLERQLLAVANDAAGEPIWGAKFRWNIRGDEYEGDILEYIHDPDIAPVSATAQTAAVEGSQSIQGRGFGTTDTMATCSVGLVGASGRSAGWLGVGLLALAGIAARRRRQLTAER